MKSQTGLENNCPHDRAKRGQKVRAKRVLKTIGYIVLFLIALNLVICFIENVIKEANQKRSEDSSEDNV
ncbi:hypothetical protein KTJ54_16560 [Acinetobacter radioresistens]|uniref:hypothetical protein n=1 Tax=Acinetobacter radioresistens TaxID=40216 RepID=UPI00112E326F|nr:hypothetical protein [Acinetobacter radioresistens]MCU4623692.1 hypothetical protein [Acinetobacter radioresistens]TPU17347.1 hypothetical protein FJU87_15055 [Acinetobacter baumannii]